MMGMVLTPNCTSNILAIMRSMNDIVYTGDKNEQETKSIQDLVGCNGSRSVRVPLGKWVCYRYHHQPQGSEV